MRDDLGKVFAQTRALDRMKGGTAASHAAADVDGGSPIDQSGRL
jgi:hypothetical protein